MAATAAVAPAAGQEVRQTSLVAANTSNGPVTDKHQQHQYEHHRDAADDSRPQPRQVVLQRHPETGFGFVAGSEKPVVVRFVKEGGPSEGKLQSEDQILEINGEDVSKAPRVRVIELVQSCKQTLKMTVCQPDRSNNTTTRKSSLLTAAKKAKLKHNPTRVRFAEGVLVNGTNTPSIYSSFDSCVPFMPNVLKVFLENGQTKTFKYDTTTLVQDVLNSLVEKLSIKNPLYLSLCVEHVKIRRRNKLILLDPKDSLSKIANRPGAHNLRCLFRVVFVPKDISELLLNDAITFEYFYAQSCNDIVQERFAPELKYEIALRLSALHLLQHAIQTGMMTNNGSKVNLKAVERECTLKPFVPYTLIETMKCKELHKLLNHYMKQNQSQLCPPGQKSLTAIQAKVHYLRIISELPSYGAKIFPMNIRETVVESALLVSRKFGLSHVANLRSSMPVTLARIEDIISVRLSNHNEFCNYVAVEVHLRNNTGEVPFLRFALEERDAEEFVLAVQGYHRLILTPQSSDLPYKELPVFSDVIQDPVPSSNSWKKGSDATSHEAAKFDGSKDDDSVEEEVERDESRKQRRRSSPPPLLYERIGSSGALNGSASSRLMSCSSQEDQEKLDKESSPPPDRWLLRSSPHNPITPHPRSMTRPPPKSSPPAPGEDERSRVNHEEDIDLPSVVSMEILELAIIAERRIKREEVEQRVAEMHRIVADAQHYLTGTGSSGFRDQDRVSGLCTNNKETQVSDDSESLKSDPDFTATDSLLLIRHTTDGREVDVGMNGGASVQTGVSFSESDTTSDSFSNASGGSPLDRTPNGSFKNQVAVRRECNTFSEDVERTFSHSVRGNGSINGIGDHSFASDQRLDQEEDESPDVSEAVPNLSDAENELIETLKKLQTEEECYMELPFMHNTASPSIIMDQEIIDLTAFPPPGEEEDQYDNLPLQHISGPGRGPGGGYLGQADPFAHDYGAEYANFSGPASLSLVNHSHTPHPTLTRVNSNCLSSVQQGSAPTSSTSSSLLTIGDNSRAGKIASIEEFIASVSIPPPPHSVRRDVSRGSSHHELEEDEDDDDLSSLIVPPPPVQQKSYPQDDVIAKFWQVTDDVKKIYATLPLSRLSANNVSSSGGLLQVSPKSGTRELHSSSSGDSGYDSIPVMPASSSSSSCHPHVPAPADSDAFALRLVLSSSSAASSSNAAAASADPQSTKPAGGRLYLSTVPESRESNNGNQIKVNGQEAAEDGTCNMNAGIGCVRADAIPSSGLIHSLPTTSIVSYCMPGTDNLMDNKNLVTAAAASSAESHSYSSTDGLRIRGKKIPPPPPLRSKPPIPPTSPSIIERRRQLAKKAQTRAKLGMLPVRESGGGEEENEGEESDSLMQMTMHPAGFAASPSHEDATSVFNEGRGAADRTQIFTDDGLDPSSCLLEQILDKNHFPSQQQQQQQHHTDALNGTEWNGMQENVIDSDTLFVQVQTNIDQLLNRLEDVHETRIRSDPSPAAGGRFCCDERILNQRKDELIIESRAFVTSSKLFVKCATEGSPEVIDHLLDCLSLLDHMCKIAEFIVMSTESQAQVTCLVDRLKEVAATFGYTIATVHKSTEQDITDPSDSNYIAKASGMPSMSQLMNHATSLATSLSALMRTLRAFSSY